MRIAFLSSIYPKHAEKIYRDNPDLKFKTSDEQMEFIRWHALSSYVKWNDYLRSKGCEVLQFHHNLNFVEMEWAKENRFSFSHKNCVWEIGLEKIKKFNPDVLYCSSPHVYIQSGFLPELISLLSKKPKLIAWYGANCGDEEIFRFFDLTLSNSKHLVSSLRKNNISSDHLQHSFDPIILDRIGLPEKQINRLGFFGNLAVDNDFDQRTKLLHEISSKTKILDIHGDIEKPNLLARAKYYCIESRQKFSNVARRILPLNRFQYWSDKGNLPPGPWQIEKKFSNSVKQSLYGNEMLKKLACYQIAFNYHNKHTGDFACNMRLFEATGLGCCLLTDHKSNIKSLFEPDVEVITYNSPHEAIDKANYLLANPNIAQEIAEAGQKKTFSEHTTEKQVDHLVFHLNNLWN
jgi:spore maturation protein CgeB